MQPYYTYTAYLTFTFVGYFDSADQANEAVFPGLVAMSANELYRIIEQARVALHSTPQFTKFHVATLPQTARLAP